MKAHILEFKKRVPAEKEDPHVSGTLRCFGCKHEWQGVFPPGQVEGFECPSCGAIKGISKYGCQPSNDDVFTCGCGCDLFVLTRTGGPMCLNCGLYHRPYDDPKGVA